MVARKSVMGSLRRTAIHALGGEERKPRPAVTHARVDRIEPQIKPAFGTLGHAQGLGIGARPQGLGIGANRPQIKPAFGYRPGQNKPWKGAHRRERGGSGNRVQGISDVAGSRTRDLRTRASNETSGMGQHLGKHTGHNQIVHPTNAISANRPRVDLGKTDFLSSMGGNPAQPNHRPHNTQSGTHKIAPKDARAMMANDGRNSIAKAVVA